jgi:allantoinase
VTPDLIVRSTRLATASGVAPGALHVQGGLVSRLAPWDEVPGGVDLDDCGDLVVMPALVDSHVHVNEPGREDWEGWVTATAAAAAGGIATIVDMPLNSVPATTTVAALHAKRASASGRCQVDVACWGGVVPGNAGELRGLADAGVAGFKAFLAPSGVDEFRHVGEADLRVSLPVLAALGLPLLVHAESPAVIDRFSAALASGDPRRYATWLASRPPDAEVRAIDLLARLGREFGARMHVVHLASAEGLAAVARARAEGVAITAETCPHYLVFAADDVPDGATVFKCAPPIRERRHRDALWEAVADRRIDLIASDHSPCPPAMKCLDTGDFVRAWGGVASLELVLPATWTGARARGVPLARLVELLCTGPFSLAGLASRKGTLAPGADADLVVWDPEAEFTVDARELFQRHRATPYAGRRLSGVVHRTYLRGRVVYHRGARPAAVEPAGRLLDRQRL